ncbi:hypothetical protein B4919_01845 [Francisella tularensis subsp. novicida]|uniref:hypothetical protein n=1 Tax=Francisella tularensis TaxID=263 RepID=UPI000CE2A2C2|nr:hypothetical protein [Francisella tularensis]AVC43618.1 hypothetical protein B4919_01845 [Francisella tularensis subsp. novicida]
MKYLTLLIIIFPIYSFGSSLKGSDFMSSDVGTKYVYNIVSQTVQSPDTKKDISEYTIEKFVKKCNKESTICTYEQKQIRKNSKDIKSKYLLIKNEGALYYQAIKKDLQILPKEILLNKKININSISPRLESKGITEITKIFPEILINKQKYKECIQVKTKYKTLIPKLAQQIKSKVKSTSIFCKNIGLVKSEYSITSFIKKNDIWQTKKIESISSLSSIRAV